MEFKYQILDQAKKLPNSKLPGETETWALFVWLGTKGESWTTTLEEPASEITHWGGGRPDVTVSPTSTAFL